ncbi:MAG: dTDP-4-dehydrorhamnose reductase [Paracoccus sp. (in: a-proteobacteria)]|nr:dTDP-4-dehydrorhamnose reductase [Paracoccus sp. (in: a-proteobacteria)]
MSIFPQKKLLVFGETGQVARELARLAPEARFVARSALDLGDDPRAIGDLIAEARPMAVINAAAYTAVDRAEAEPDLARRINADAPGAMAAACARLAIPFVHISTDYVFDGSGNEARDEDAQAAPLGVYGSSKLAGEAAVADAGGQYAVLRTSWVFSVHGQNFVKTMLRLGAEREALRIVSDQIGGPTPARDIAAACLSMAGKMTADAAKGGVYHFSGAPELSWADFAAEIFARAGITCRIEPIPSADYPTPARRPLNSRLDCAKITRDFGVARPDWRTGLDEVLEELEARP